MIFVRPKKHLGQHFLKDENIAKKIAGALTYQAYNNVLEVGSGTGVLTKYLLQKDPAGLVLIELDADSVRVLEERFPSARIIAGDFLKTEIRDFFPGPFAVIGNFPYNISSQILFKVLDNKEHIPELVGMFQKEVAERITAIPRTKAYGIISVLAQSFYDTEYLFTVSENVFFPPPKVKSAVIRMRRKEGVHISCGEDFLKTVVKTAFNQRRKKLINALRSLLPADSRLFAEYLDKRAEELSPAEFLALAVLLLAKK